MTIWHILLGIGLFLACGLLIDAVRDILRTLKRIESRLALLNSLEPEIKAFKDSSSVRHQVEEKAIHPAVWTHRVVEALSRSKKVSDEEYKRGRKFLRASERKRDRLY